MSGAASPARGLALVRARALALAGLLLACSAPPPTSDERPIRRVDHFNVRSPDVAAMAETLSRHLGLRVLWPPVSFGSVTVAGLSLGNTVVELIDDGTAGATSALAAIAFEPAGDAAEAARWLDRQGLEHTTPRLFPPDGGDADALRWETLYLRGLVSAPAEIYLCDYKDRERVESFRIEAAEALRQANGGPIGLESVAEIVVGHADLASARTVWTRLLGGWESPSEPGLFRFDRGPAVRLVESERGGILEVVLVVRSLEVARAYLREQGLLGEGGGVDLGDASGPLLGLHFVLRERQT